MIQRFNQVEQRNSSIEELIAMNNGSDVDVLSTDAQTLFGLLKLIVDIQYRLKYGDSVEEKESKRYSETQ